MLSGGQLEWKKALLDLLKEPIIISIILAFLANQLKIGLPTPVQRSVDLLAQAAIPGKILVLGMRFFQSKIEWKPVLWWAVALRLIIIPLAAFPLGHALQLSGPALQAGMLQASTPAGVS
jgi:predicted permease